VQTVPLGRTDLLVSRICLGTMTFGKQADETVSRAILDTAADAGVTFIDTADVYPQNATGATLGRTEEIVGRWMAGRRDEFVLATKFGFPTGPGPDDRGGSRKHVIQAIDASLRRLQTDHVDLYQIHIGDRDTPIEETLAALDELVQAGKVRYVGCSNFRTSELRAALTASQSRSLVRFDTLQPRYNLLYRAIEDGLLPLCRQEDIGVIAYNPLAGGLLTGKHRYEAVPDDGSRFTTGASGDVYRGLYWQEAEFAALARIQATLDGTGVSMLAAALGWMLAQPGVTSAIVGASSPDQLRQSLAAAQVPIPDDVLARLDRATSPVDEPA
jgi:1-deoxyxylulose-5-phosphate synthase